MALDDRLFIYPGPVLRELPRYHGHVAEARIAEEQRLARIERELERLEKSPIISPTR